MSIAESPRSPEATGLLFDLDSPSLAALGALGPVQQAQHRDMLGGLAQGAHVGHGRVSSCLVLVQVQSNTMYCQPTGPLR